MLKKLKNLGPGLLVMAAFTGPGTVTTASVAGSTYGFVLLWAIAFAIFAAIVLQEMAGRLGLVSRQGLGEAISKSFENPVTRFLAIALVMVAIAFGNAAFETGNIIGTAIGLETIVGGSTQLWSALVGMIAFALLFLGVYKVIERVLVVLVVTMSIVFLIAAVMARPDIGQILSGLLIPRIPQDSLLTVVALIGTTVVPYNLFLYASSVQEKWSEQASTSEALDESRFDITFSILLGGIIAIAIITTAAAAFFGQNVEIDSAGTMAQQLEPLLGPAARIFFAIGLSAAGITSTVTAPLATAYAVCGAMGWQRDLKSNKFRSVWITILVFGTVLAAAGQKPVQAIVFSQAANGVLLPIVAIFLLVVMNRSDLLGEFKNRTVANVLGGLVVLIATILGGIQFLKAIGVI
ncbi:MAG: Nramp family divalent metal transporter [Leptolyngbyaceae cyanobacterium]